MTNYKLNRLFDKISKEDIETYYIDHTTAETAKHYSISVGLVKKLLKHYNIELHSIGYQSTMLHERDRQNLFKDINLDKDKLCEYYIIENHTRKQTADYFGISDSKLKAILSYFNINKDVKLSSKNSARTNKNKSSKEKETIDTKRKCTKLERYGSENYNNMEKSWQTRLEKYGCYETKDTINKSKMTKLERYGSTSYVNPEKAKETNIKKYGVVHKNCLEENKQKIAATQKANNNGKYAFNNIEKKKEHGTANYSKPEEDYYLVLCNEYGKDNVIRQYHDDRYPFACDFYIKSKDEFIELNLYPTHYTEPFDCNNEDHIKLLEHCKSDPKNYIEEQMVSIWAGTDVKKLETALKNKLNYIQIYSGKEYIYE